MLTFSVVVPNYNYGQYVEACLDSLEQQTLDARRYEVLLADDGSKDDSLARVERWAAAHPHMALRVLPGTHCGHPGAVRNRAVREARAPWILCLDSDDMLAQDSLAALAQALTALSGPAAAEICWQGAAGAADQPDRERTHIPVVLAPYCVEVQDGELLAVRIPPFDPDLIRRQHPCSHAVCYQRDLWRAVGGYHESCPYEDWDFLLRAVVVGAVWQGVPGAVHLYRRHAGSVSESAQRQDMQTKAEMVLRSAAFFAPEVVWWAEQVRRELPWVCAFPRGVIPSAENLHQWHAQCVARLGDKAASFFPRRLFGKIIP